MRVKQKCICTMGISHSVVYGTLGEIHLSPVPHTLSPWISFTPKAQLSFWQSVFWARISSSSFLWAIESSVVGCQKINKEIKWSKHM